MLLACRCTSRSLSACSQLLRKSPAISQQAAVWNALSNSTASTNSGSTGIRFFSEQDQSGSHSDFAAKRATISDSDKALQLIQQHVKDNPIMLYMKGSPHLPMCGFSAKVVKILNEQDVDFSSVNVLDYPAIREGVKKFSDWPTIPQLYVNGEFIGGCDIITSMHESGELKELLQQVKKA